MVRHNGACFKSSRKQKGMCNIFFRSGPIGHRACRLQADFPWPRLTSSFASWLRGAPGIRRGVGDCRFQGSSFAERLPISPFNLRDSPFAGWHCRPGNRFFSKLELVAGPAAWQQPSLAGARAAAQCRVAPVHVICGYEERKTNHRTLWQLVVSDVSCRTTGVVNRWIRGTHLSHPSLLEMQRFAPAHCILPIIKSAKSPWLACPISKAGLFTINSQSDGNGVPSCCGTQLQIAKGDFELISDSLEFCVLEASGRGQVGSLEALMESRFRAMPHRRWAA